MARISMNDPASPSPRDGQGSSMPIRERPPHLGHGLRAKLAAVYRIAERDLLAQLRSRAFLIQTVLLPFVLTLIIGMALGSGKALEDVPVALVAEASALVDRLEASLTSTKVIKVIRLSDAEAREAVRNGRAVAMIHIPDGLERRLLRRTVQNDVKLIGDPARSEQFVLIEQLVRTNLTALEAGRAAVLGAVEALKPEDATQLGQALERSSQAVTTALAKSPVTFTNSTASGRAQGFFTYFAVAFGVMFTLLSATNGAGGVLDEVERGTITRLLGSPLGAPLLFFSKFLALLVIALTQLGLYMLLTTLLFSASWGTLPLVLLGLLATATAAAGFGAIVAGLAQSHEQVNVIGMVLTLGMGLLGGSIWPIETLPGPVQFLSRFTYNRWAIETFQTLAVPGFDLTDIWVAVLVLFAMGLVGLAFGAWRLSRWLKL